MTNYYYDKNMFPWLKNLSHIIVFRMLFDFIKVGYAILPTT